MKFGNFPESLLVIYVAQVLRGLLYLHEQGVIHRYVKPTTVVVEDLHAEIRTSTEISKVPTSCSLKTEHVNLQTLAAAAMLL